MQEVVINFDDPHARNLFLSKVRELTGRWRFQYCRHRNRRTDSQNRYYWACHVALFADWIREEWGEAITDEQAHESLKKEFLTKSIVNHKTGEIREYVDSSALQDVVQFSEYLERIEVHLVDYCNIVVPPAGGWIDEPNRKDVKRHAIV